MTDLGAPAAAELPTLRELNRATILAAAAAAVILVAAVLPAEYGVDPTGLGRILGLTRMGEVKRAQASNAAGAAVPSGDTSITRTADGGTQVRIILRPYGGREVKAWMKAGEKIDYEWATDGAPIEFEFHGDPTNAKGDEYTSYDKRTAPGAKGTFTAAFSGRHGWYWHNLTPYPLTITATVKGQFEKFEPLS